MFKLVNWKIHRNEHEYINRDSYCTWTINLKTKIVNLA